MPKDPAPKSKFDEYLAKLAADPSKVGILTEGDSWFAIPLPSRPNVVEVLIKKFTGKAAWLRLEGNGDEARIMQAGAQWEKTFKLLTKPKARFDIIMFSAGGNDIVGRCLLPLLRQQESWMTWRDCINEQRFQRRLDQIEGAYRGCWPCEMITTRRPGSSRTITTARSRSTSRSASVRSRSARG